MRSSSGNLPARIRALLTVVALVALLAGVPDQQAFAQQRTVTVAAFNIPPLVEINNGAHTGFAIELWNEITKRTGWNTNYIDVPTVPDQLSAVAAGRADVTTGAVSITVDRADAFDFSQPTLNSGLQIIVPYAKSGDTATSGLKDFLKLLFSESMVVLLLSAVLITAIPAHLIWLAERRHPTSRLVSKSYFPGIFEALQYGMEKLTSSSSDAPRHGLSRTIAVVWAFVGVIFVAHYTAALTSNLTVAKFNAKITSPSDLLNKKVCTEGSTTSSEFLHELGVEPTEVPEITGCYDGLKKKKFDAVVFDAPVLHFFVANAGAGVAMMAGPVFDAQDYGMAFRPGDRLRREVDHALLSIRQDGTYALMRSKWFGKPEPGTPGG